MTNLSSVNYHWKLEAVTALKEINYRTAFPAPVLSSSPWCLAVSFLPQFMPPNQSLLKKNILFSLQILWEWAVGGKQMENAFVYIKLWNVQEASSIPHPELQVWAYTFGGRKGVICILWGDWGCGQGTNGLLLTTVHQAGSTVESGKQTMEVTRQADGAKKLKKRKK